jgi:hypothetical protein
MKTFRIAAVLAAAALSLPALASESSAVSQDPTFPQDVAVSPAFAVTGAPSDILAGDPTQPAVAAAPGLEAGTLTAQHNDGTQPDVNALAGAVVNAPAHVAAR